MSDYENLLYQITSRIRQSLDLKEVLESAVKEIFKLLKVDRVKIYRFELDGSGEVIAEAVNAETLPSLLNLRFPAADIPPEARAQFLKSRLRVIVDVSAQRKTVSSREELPLHTGTAKPTDYRQVDPCHLEYLSAMGVASSLVMPILHQEGLWGLLAVHHSTPRRFSERELQILQLLADQLEIAIAQSSLLLQAQQQAEHEAIVSRVGQILHYPLALPSLRQQVLETLVKELNASGGRLHLLGDRVNPHSQTYTIGDQPLEPALEDLPLWQAWVDQQIRGLVVEPNPEIHPAFARQELASLGSGQSAVYPSSQPFSGTLLDLQQDLWKPLVALFDPTPIRSFLVIPLAFQEHYLGYITLFRRGYNVSIAWAGQCDSNQRLRFPKLSFEVWRELRQDQPDRWSAEELKLLQAIGLHLSMSILQRRIEAMVRYQSSHDSLTGLPNRLLFTERLTLALMEADQSNEMIGIAILDINRFKRINESLGSEAGDLLLQQVAERLQANLRPQDFLARWGSDEFTLLLPGLHSAEDVLALIEEIMRHVAEPFHLHDREIYITSSLGMALAPYDGEDADTLLRCASVAVKKAQQEGLHTFQLYQREKGPAALEALTLEGDLRRALISQQLELYYQPQLEIATGRLIGLEALIRWQHPTLGFISPGEFIPLAEETGLIHDIGRWALQTACQQQQLWGEAGFPDLRVCVNLSPKQFYRADLPQLIWEALNTYSVSPACLELEITESAAMQDMDSAIRMLKQLRQMGIRIALDDFGTGYSSLTAIKHFPLDTLKLDKAFTQDLMDNPGDAAIAQTIVALGRGLGLTVIAEGVESESQLHVLLGLQCHCAQGYLFSRPLSAQGMMRFIQEYCAPEGEKICCKNRTTHLRF
ncbi:EAL domain-containing protein [Pseudanabaena sp. FACHB-2040]|uniref:EAL domain-containing protein n=1 Tax=Pseudanabaena sp. FACHB-2040 TaxID=2692859 RepID=UPI0018EFF8A0